ncbi:MAG: TIGR02444 family protein [Shewanella sp.]|nr:TIGR02444 family protein [Shewanella sp.]
MPNLSTIQHAEFTKIWQQCEQTYLSHQIRCLQLQDEFGINVNLLLLAHHLDNYTDDKYSTEQWQSFINSVAQWESKILLPYRKLRKFSKGMIEQTEYQQMLDVELMMERRSQRLITYKLQTCSSNATTTNIKNYLSLYNLNDYVLEFS